MSDIYINSDIIAGGIDVIGSTITGGGHVRVVGENTNWYMRNKFLQLKHLSTSTNANEKNLLKIINLKLPLTFGKKLTFYDDEKSIPLKSKRDSSEDIYIKAIEVLDKRLHMPVNKLVDTLITEYNLMAPLSLVLGDVVKFLAVINKKKNPDSKKIKISPEMAVMVENMWRPDVYFQYMVNSDSIPNNMIKLAIRMLDIVKKNNPPQGVWVEPNLEIVEYPCLCTLKKTKVSNMINDEKKKLDVKIKKNKNLDNIKEYISTILTIENIIINHVNDIEKYFIIAAENMNKILASLKKFFRSHNTPGVVSSG